MSVQNNKLIALFMGAEDMQTYLSFKHIKHDSLPIKGQWYYMFTELQYDKSWEWLMPVVEQISSLYMVKETAVKSTGTRIWLHKSAGYIQENAKDRNMLADCYSTIVKFIDWYLNQEDT